MSARWEGGFDVNDSDSLNPPANLRGTLVIIGGYRFRDRGVSSGHDGDGGRTGFSGFSVRATNRQASTQPVGSDFISLRTRILT